jgi:uncharacterized protein
VSTTSPEGIDQYALRVAEKWKLGREKVDDGVILVVAKDDRTVRIEVGYGLEGALTDIVSKRIISEIIVPNFKQGQYFSGIQLGVAQIMAVVNGEALPPSTSSNRNDPNFRQYIPFLFILTLSVGGLLRRAFGKMGGSVATGLLVTGLAWLVIGSLMIAVFAGVAGMFLTLVGAASMLHGMGGMARGGRQGTGGGFSGGGGFGGGGASGRW